MKEFSDYQVANITDEVKLQITDLEKKIEKENGHQVVLIAYQEKQS
jgi:hypothetical protein